MPILARLFTAAAASLLLAGTALAFDLQGHRGARGLAPENTLPAFEQALALGVDTLELDIGVTADGQVVVAHDPALNPAITRDAAGQWLADAPRPLLKSLTLAQLQAYDVGRIRPGTSYANTFAAQQGRDGTRIPTLAQVFALVQARRAPVRFNIETKINPNRPEDTVAPEAMVQALLATIRAAGMESRVAIQSFDWRTLQLVQRLAPGIPTVYLTNEAMHAGNNVRDGTWNAGFTLAALGSVPQMVQTAGGKVWSPNLGALTQERVRQAQALGLQVIPWTVNEPADMERLLDWRVDGIITDYPDRLRAVMAGRGMPLPAPVR